MRIDPHEQLLDMAAITKPAPGAVMTFTPIIHELPIASKDRLTNTPNFTIDPAIQSLIPPSTSEERSKLEASILREGVRDALVVWQEENILLDGHNRLEIAERHGLKYETTTISLPSRDEAELWVIENQFARRNLTPGQRIELTVKREGITARLAKKNLTTPTGGRSSLTLTNSSKSPVHTRKISAKQAGVSEDTYRKGKLILKEAPFELKEKYRKGDVSTNEAYKQVKAAEKAEAKAAIVERIKNEPMPIPEGPFRVIVIDPPWPYESRAEDPTHRAKTPYPSMRLEEIAALPVPELAHKDCILWLWTTNAFMHEAFHLLEGWGFQSKTILTWVKSRMGVGDWLRGQTEHCLMAIRGKPIVILTNETTALVADNKDHSTKPVDFYTRVESLCPGSKLEMFARQKREGWEQWGSERFYDIPDNPVPILGQGYGKGKTEYKLAKLAGIGHGTFHKIQAIDREASEDLKRRVDAGEISINRAYQEIGMRKKEGGISHKAENPAFAIIRDMTLKGQPNRVIAEELNRRKVPRLSGISKPWHGRDVYEVRARSMPSIFPRPRDVSTLPPETQTPEKLHNNILFRATMVNGDIESKVALVEQICRNVSEGIMESHIAEYHNNEHDVGACAMEGY